MLFTHYSRGINSRFRLAVNSIHMIESEITIGRGRIEFDALFWFEREDVFACIFGIFLMGGGAYEARWYRLTFRFPFSLQCGGPPVCDGIAASCLCVHRLPFLSGRRVLWHCVSASALTYPGQEAECKPVSLQKF